MNSFDLANLCLVAGCPQNAGQDDVINLITCEDAELRRAVVKIAQRPSNNGRKWIIRFEKPEDKNRCLSKFNKWKDQQQSRGEDVPIKLEWSYLHDIPEDWTSPSTKTAPKSKTEEADYDESEELLEVDNQSVSSQDSVQTFCSSGSSMSCVSFAEDCIPPLSSWNPVGHGSTVTPYAISRHAVLHCSGAGSKELSSQPAMSVAIKVANRKQCTIAGKNVTMKLMSTNPLSEEEKEARRSVEVTLSEKLAVQDEDIFRDYFENRRHGGGAVEDVRLDEKAGIIRVVFEQAAVARRVAERSHTLCEQKLEVKMATIREVSDDEREARRTVEVTVGQEFPLDESLSRDIFRNHFENPRHDGGEVEDVRVYSDRKIVHVIFKETKVAKNIVKKEKHKISRLPVTVRMLNYVALTDEDKKERRTVQVTVGQDFPLMEKDTFRDYFENPRKGGFKVETVTLKKKTGTVYITFEDRETDTGIQPTDNLLGLRPMQCNRSVTSA